MSHVVVAEEAAPLIDADWTVLLQFGLFLIMFVALSRLMWRPYLRVREERDRGITGARKEAKGAEDRAQAIVTDYEEKISRAKQRGVEERMKLRTEGANRESELLSAARVEAQKALDATKAKVATQAATARTQLDRDAAVIANDMAAKVLGRSVQA